MEVRTNKVYRIFGNRFTKEEYDVIMSGLKKIKRKDENNTDVLIKLLKKEVRSTLKNNIYKLNNRMYILEKNEIESILKLYFNRKKELFCFSQVISLKYGLINLKLVDRFGKNYGIAIFDEKKKDFDEKLSNYLKKFPIFLWDPENLCKIKGVKRIDTEEINLFITENKLII